MNFIFLLLESITIFIAVLYGIFWVRNPQGNYEPIIALSGSIGLVLEFVRRFVNQRNETQKPIAKSNKASLVLWIQENISTLELSQLLPEVIRLGKMLKNENLVKWARLEYNGYYNEYGMLKDDVVPEYRTIPGQHTDEYGRPLVFSDPKMGFVNETRLRNGVKELEEFAQRHDMVYFRDASMSKIIKENFGIEVTRFEFSATSISGMLDRIRSELIDRMGAI